MANTFKIVLIGPTNVGKTTFLHRHLNGQFLTEHIPTLGVEVHPLHFATSHRDVCLNVWDCAGDDNFGGLRDGYYIQAHGGIVMADLTCTNFSGQITPWLEDLYRVCPSIPVVVCGNKVDEKERKISANEIATWLHSGPFQRGVHYYDVSARSNYNFEKPFLELVRQLTAHPDLVFVDNPAIVLPEGTL